MKRSSLTPAPPTKRALVDPAAPYADENPINPHAPPGWACLWCERQTGRPAPGPGEGKTLCSRCSRSW
eukprot:CAMPEP_0119277476 /NCGR_PEP_ID=MMETSP1329-20130426/17214_1 /TAXON_ID=114041 /ORGANISM="Genus nov. species nov., Strain RCC1024" /LENGTH=67 /DNA_ID=CAMNT_0007277945 /DNA_START=145 /DNA_END=345 /DNA_ORIENTATION=+